MQTALSADSKLIMEHAVMEALRTPGNKIVLRRNLDSLGISHSKKNRGDCGGIPISILLGTCPLLRLDGIQLKKNLTIMTYLIG